jgi:hypothetical protein
LKLTTALFRVGGLVGGLVIASLIVAARCVLFTGIPA